MCLRAQVRRSPAPGIFFLAKQNRDNLNGMQKPPFQFRLKAVFGAMGAAALFAFFAVPGREAAERVAALAVIAAWAVIAVFLLGVLAAFVLSVSMTFYHGIPLCRRLGSKFRLPGRHRSRSSQNPIASARGDAVG